MHSTYTDSKVKQSELPRLSNEYVHWVAVVALEAGAPWISLSTPPELHLTPSLSLPRLCYLIHKRHGLRDRCVCWFDGPVFIRHSGLEQNHFIFLTTDRFTVKFTSNIHGPQRLNHNNFLNSLTFHLSFSPRINSFSSFEEIQPWPCLCLFSELYQCIEWVMGVNMQQVNFDSRPVQLHTG